MRALAAALCLILAVPAAAQQSPVRPGSALVLGKAYGAAAVVGPTFTFKQDATNNGFSGTTVTASLSGVIAGDDIRIAVWNVQTAAGTVTATSTGGSCSTITHVSGGSVTAWLFACPNSSSGSVTVTATSSTTISNIQIIAEEWNGDAASPVDGGASAYLTTSGAVSSGSFTTTANGDQIWSVLFQEQNLTPTVGTGFTMNINGFLGASSNLGWDETLILSTAGSTAGTWVAQSGSTNTWVLAAGFK